MLCLHVFMGIWRIIPYKVLLLFAINISTQNFRTEEKTSTCELRNLSRAIANSKLLEIHFCNQDKNYI